MKAVYLIILLFLLHSCSSEDCNSARETVLCLEDLGCFNAPYNVSVETLKEFELIRNQEDFDRMVFSNCEFQIDWNINDLVIGTKGLSGGLSSINKTLLTDCNANQKFLTVDISLDLTNIAPIVTWQAVIPKLDDTESLFVMVNVN